MTSDTASRVGSDLERKALGALRAMRERLEALEAARTEPLAVVGMGCRLPGADGPEAFWDLLRSGADAVSHIPPQRWDVARYSRPDPHSERKVSHHAGVLDQVDGFDAEFFGIAGREALLLDPQQRLLLEVVWEALEHAGIPALGLRGSRTGVFIGTTTTDYLRLITQRLPTAELDAYVASGNTLNTAAGRVSYLLGLHGPCIAMDTACSSSLVAIDRACRSVRDGECRLAIAGGVNLLLAPEFLVSLARWGMLSPDGRCKTFDAAANGFVRAEGCGMVLVKRLSHARADGDRICALIRGSAVNQDGPSSGLTVPNGLAQAEVIREALAAGKVDACSVGYVEAHGTGTTLGDPIEMEALTTVYGAGRDRARPLWVGAVKTNLGHLEAASGVAGLIKTTLALQHRQIPANLHFRTPTPHIPWDRIAVRVPTALESWAPLDGRRLAGVSAFGFSGTNAHVVLEEAPPPSHDSTPLPASLPGRSPRLLTLSARSAGALRALATSYADRLCGQPRPDVDAFCVAASAARSHLPLRLAVVANDADELAARLHSMAAGNLADGVLQGDAAASRNAGVVFLFTGQGAQYEGMGRALAEASPVFRAALERCAAIMDPLLERPLLEVMHGREGAGSVLHQTGYTQPGLFALEWALAQMWQSFGLRPAAVVGHSVGEFAAACVAGVLSLEDAARLVVLRGQLMQALPAGGAMAAVFASESALAQHLAEPAGVIALAGVNAPEELVVSGDAGAIAALRTRLASQGIRSEPLQVSHAFHSPLMQPMVARFEAAAQAIVRLEPQCRIVSTVTGKPADAQWGSAEYWVRQLQAPVRYADAIRTAAAHGISIALELGPHPVLAGLGQRCLPDAPIRWQASLRRGLDDWPVAMAALARLYVHGAVGDWSGAAGAQQRSRVALPSYPFQRSRYWVDEPVAPPRSAANSALSWCHPLLGARLPLARGDRVFQVEAGHAVHRSLRDHRLHGNMIWPATAILEMALAAGRDALGAGGLQLRNAEFRSPMAIPEAATRTVQTLLRPAGAEGLALEFCALTGGRGDDWTVFASVATLGRSTTAGASSRVAPWSDALQRCPVTLAPPTVYAALDQRGIDFGPSFRTLGQVHTGVLEAVGFVRLAEIDAATASEFLLHPALLDGCFQLAFVAAGGAAEDAHPLLVPADVARLDWHAPAGASLWCHATVRPRPDNIPGIVADLELWREDGERIASVEGLRLERVPDAGLASAPVDLLSTAGYEIVWQPSHGKLGSAATERRWLVLDSGDPLGADLRDLLHANGETCEFLPTTSDKADRTPLARMIEPAIGRLGGRPDCVVYLASDAGRSTSDRCDTSFAALDTALALSQACVESPALETTRLWFVTRGAQAVHEGEAASPAAASLWGLGRVLRVEHPELGCSLLDLGPRTGVADLFDTVRTAEPEESQLALRGGVCFAARLAPLSPMPELRLASPRPGQIDDLAWARVGSRPPGPREICVEVRAAGLNFRDVLCALGLYPDVVEALGGECAGIVSAIGAEVRGIVVGEAVMAFAPGSLGTSVIVPAPFAVAKPASLSFEQAAGQPVACMTASYALERLAGLRAGERVLIHAAAGGVGLAAVHVAQLCGAEVFATAGTEAKRELLHSLGVRHVMNSRSLAFRDELMARTDGAGVHVALNSLAGEFIGATLATLAPGGRFVEMGKRDIWSANAVAQVRPDVSYLPFDLGAAAVAAPNLAAELLSTLASRLESGALPPLPVSVHSLAAPHDAFRTMAQGRHTGKLVFRQDLRLCGADVLPRAEATYLVTGGLGFLGLQAACELARRGARHLVLVGRAGPTPQALAVLERLRADGVSVRTASLDVAEFEPLRLLLEEVAATMPPLRGLIHAAGVLDDGVLTTQSSTRLERVLAPKLRGAWNLDRSSRSLDLDFFVLFSAGAAWLGSPGQANYAAANAALDALAHARRAAGLPALSIAWGRWAGGGMAAARENGAPSWDAFGVGAIAIQSGFEAMFELLRRRAISAAVLPVDWRRYLARLHRSRAPGFFAQVLAGAPAGIVTPSHAPPVGEAGLVADLLQTPADQRRAALHQRLESILRRIVGLPVGQLVDPRRPLRELGMDSLMTVELRNAIGQAFERTLPATLVFDYPTLDALGAHLMSVVPGLEADAARQSAPTLPSVRELQLMSDDEAEAMLVRELSEGSR